MAVRRHLGSTIFPATISTCIAAVLLSDGEVMLKIMLAGWGVIAIAVVAWCWPRAVATGPQPLLPPASLGALFTALVLLYAALSLTVIARVREYSLSAVSSSNLRGIGDALRAYCAKFGVPPATLDVLIAEGLSTPGQFIHPFDADTREDPGGRVERSSYILVNLAAPCRSDATPVAYEREPWSPLRASIARYSLGHQILLADGSIRRVTPAELQRLLDTSDAP